MHPSLTVSRCRPDLGSECFSVQSDVKVSGQVIESKLRSHTWSQVAATNQQDCSSAQTHPNQTDSILETGSPVKIQIVNCTIFRGRRVVENATRFKVLLCSMEQRPQVVRDILLTCVLLHKMLRTPQVGVARTPKTQNEVPTIVNDPIVCGADENCRNPSRDAKQQRNFSRITSPMLVHWLGRRELDDVTRIYPWDKRSWHLLLLFRTTKIFQELFHLS